jgi:hypothetical protein
MRNRSWLALLCLALSAGDAPCLAADTALPRAPAARVPARIEPARGGAKEAAAKGAEAHAAAAAPQNAAPARPQPVPNKVSLLEALAGAMGGENAALAKKQREAAEDQNLRNLEAQFRPQFEQLLYIELALLRRVTKPDAEVFVEIAKTAKAGLHVPLREYARTVSGPQGIIMVQQGNVVNRGATPDDPRLALQKLLAPLAETKLGPDKAKLYRQECDKRSEARKRAVIMNLVAVLDERLVLNAPQRTKLVESLMPKYESSWEYLCEIYSSNPQYTPAIPDPVIVPLLDENQKKVWNQASKPNFGVSANVIRGSQFGDSPEIQEITHMVEEVKDGP